MDQYISKSVIMAEIDRIRKEECPIDTYEGRIKLFYFERFISFLDTIKMKEVDLEKEYDNEFFKDPVFVKLVNRNAGISIAKHFFELGLKVKQNNDSNRKNI